MRTFKFFLPIVALLCLISSLQAQSAQAETAIWATMDKVFTSFNDRNAESFVSFFTEDADMVTPDGMHVHGRNAIKASQAGYFQYLISQGIEATADVISNKKVSFLTSSLALASLQVGEKIDDADPPLQFGVLFSLVQGKWLIRSVQMTPILR